MIVEVGTTKYIIYAKVIVDGYVEKHDIIGAIFGQTEGLLGCDLDLRDLQKSGRIGRIDVQLENINGKSYANLILPSSLDRLETAIIAATIETSDRVGPCVASIEVTHIEDIRVKKKEYIINRAKELLNSIVETTIDATEISEEIKEFVRSKEIIEYGKSKLPGGPNILESETIIIVEGRADVLNLLRCGIKNAIAVGGTSIPDEIKELSKKKITTIYTDGDRGGELILREALQTCDIDYIARAPPGREVEELTKKEVIKYLRSKIPIEQYIQNTANGITNENINNSNNLNEGLLNKYLSKDNTIIENEILQKLDTEVHKYTNKSKCSNANLCKDIECLEKNSQEKRISNINKINIIDNKTNNTDNTIIDYNNGNGSNNINISDNNKDGGCALNIKNNTTTIDNISTTMSTEKTCNCNNTNIFTEEDNNVEIKSEKIDIDICELIKKEPSEQSKYFKLLFEKLDNRDVVKIITLDGEIKTIPLKNIKNIDKGSIVAILFNRPITQKIADLFNDYNTTIIGNEINIIKKPANLKIFSYSAIMD